MPFLKKIAVPAGTIGIWKLSETSSELTAGLSLSKSEQSLFDTFKNEKRKKEYLAVRALLKKLVGSDFTITYEKSGRPRLQNHPANISISHSAELVVVFISKKNIGIDVENIHRKISHITKRFLSPAEIKHVNQTPDKQLMHIIYWSAKEAIFKCTTEENVQFNRHINIKPFDLKEAGNFSAELTIGEHKSHFELRYFPAENNVVVYCVEL